PTPTKPGTPPTPTVNNGKPQSTLGLSLNLSDGGHSKLTPNNGSIWNASLMPPSGAGFTRRSEDGKAYASGFLVGFIQESARRFALDNPNCGALNINQISLKKGGYFKGHASHRNGSDIDLAYFNNPPGTKVVRYLKTTVVNNKNKKKKTVYRATTKNDFDHLCFLKYLKFMDDQKLTNTGDSRYDGDDIVDLVFVNAGVQAGVCSYMKQNKLTQKYGEAVNLMYPETGHDGHFHLRMRCSPKHLECRPKDLDRVAPFKKRGCR
ncbi:MAG: penicillin-insensitive murein endopeptidase, partial [Bdellovibrionota bacterium]